MSLGIIIGITFIVIALLGGVFLLFFSRNNVSNGFKSSHSKFDDKELTNDGELDFVVVERKANGKYTLRQKMIYANWHFPPILFILLRLIVSFLFFMIASMFFKPFLSIVIAFLGFAFVNSFLDKAIKKRFEAFDKDYPSFLQSVVSLLKSGMNVLSAIDAAAEGLEETSLLRQEAQIMLERLRMGAGEDKAIGNFGATIDHPEIELFIQAIILGKSLGGSLSTTLDRLAAQIRKRQYFRSSAVSAIAQQKGSLWVIVGILSGLICIMAIKSPKLFEAALASNIGHIILEIGIAIILFGIYWIKQIVKIKV